MKDIDIGGQNQHAMCTGPLGLNGVYLFPILNISVSNNVTNVYDS